MKIIYIVREPISRIVSHFNHWARTYPEVYNDIEISLGSTKHRKLFLDRTRYFYQISAYRDKFSDDNICVVFLDELKKNFIPTLNHVFTFLGVEPSASSISARIYNKKPQQTERTWTKDDISMTRQAEIVSYLRDDVQEFLAYSGKSPDFWGPQYL